MNRKEVILTLDKRLEDAKQLQLELNERAISPDLFICGKGQLLDTFSYNHFDEEVEGRQQAYNYTLCLRKIIRKYDDYDCIWFMEDDAILGPKFDDCFYPFYHEFLKLNKKWDMLFVGGNLCNGTNYLVSDNIIQSNYILDMHSVILNRSMYSVIRSIEPSTSSTLDGILAERMKNGQIKAFCFNPSLMTQKPGWSENEQRIVNRSENHYLG